MAISGDGKRIIIGSPSHDGANGEDSGHTRVFQEMIDGAGMTNWMPIGSNIDGTNAGDGAGSSVAISGDGSRIINGGKSGRARVFQGVFQEGNGSWIQVGNAIDGENVAISDDGKRIVVASPLNDGSNGNKIDSGLVQIFEEVDGSWIQIGSDIVGDHAGENAGYSVDISGDGKLVIVGSPSNGADGQDSGYARIFEEMNREWIQVGNNIDNENVGDNTGYSVAMSLDGNRIIVGSHVSFGVNGQGSGQSRIFEQVDGDWTQVGNHINGENAYDYSGWSVNISGDGKRVIVGSPFNAGVNGNSGHARVYHEVDGKWFQLGNDIDGENTLDQAGFSVAISSDGERVIVGSPFNFGANGGYSGHARVFQPPSSSPLPPTSSPSSLIGIIVASVCTIALLAVAGAFIYYRYSRKNETNPNNAYDNDEDIIWAVEKKNEDSSWGDDEKRFDAFLTHNWGMDAQDRDNHERVVRFKNELQKSGIDQMWLDEERMMGNIVQQMCDGIEQSRFVIIFVTQKYIDKVKGKGPKGDRDNCKLEFDYAAGKKGSNKLIAVVMEDGCSNSSKWDGPVGMHLGGHLYFSFAKDSDLQDCAMKVADEIKNRCALSLAQPSISQQSQSQPPVGES